jgi:hypothetical protein
MVRGLYAQTCYVTVTQKIARLEASTAATLQNLSPRQSCEIEFNPASLVICPARESYIIGSHQLSQKFISDGQAMLSR